MKKVISSFIKFFLLLIVVVGCENSTIDKPKEVFVENGNPHQVIKSGGEWTQSGNYLSGNGINNFLIAGKEISVGDFRVYARLSLDSLNFSAASIMVFGSNFGFDSGSALNGGKPKLFVEGPLFEKSIQLEDAEKYIKPAVPFDAEIVGKGENISFLINGKDVYSSKIVRKVTGNIAMRPWRNGMKIYDFSASGQMVDVDLISYLYESGTDGYKTFRIPAILTTVKGTILAFAEGRRNGSSDTGDIDLVLKRSEDNGKTWSNLMVVWNDGENVCGNPAPVVDKTTGTIFLLSTWNLGSDHESDIIKQTSKDSRMVYLLSSTDDGKTWSAAKEITTSVKLNNWTWYATGPCHGIQIEKGKNKGRLIIPCDHIEAVTNKYFSHITYSDDNGKNWKLGGTTPQDQVNECTIAELSDGRLMLNMRNYDRTEKSRKVSVSNDGGLTWSTIYSDKTLIEPICQGSLYRFSFSDEGKSRLLFLNPANENSRQNMTLRLSTDEGATWSKSMVLYGGPSAYSDLTRLPNGNIGCFYEAGNINPYQGIIYHEISLSEFEK